MLGEFWVLSVSNFSYINPIATNDFLAYFSVPTFFRICSQQAVKLFEHYQVWLSHVFSQPWKENVATQSYHESINTRHIRRKGLVFVYICTTSTETQEYYNYCDKQCWGCLRITTSNYISTSTRIIILDRDKIAVNGKKFLIHFTELRGFL